MVAQSAAAAEAECAGEVAFQVGDAQGAQEAGREFVACLVGAADVAGQGVVDGWWATQVAAGVGGQVVVAGTLMDLEWLAGAAVCECPWVLGAVCEEWLSHTPGVVGLGQGLELALGLGLALWRGCGHDHETCCGPVIPSLSVCGQHVPASLSERDRSFYSQTPPALCLHRYTQTRCLEQTVPHAAQAPHTWNREKTNES